MRSKLENDDHFPKRYMALDCAYDKIFSERLSSALEVGRRLIVLFRQWPVMACRHLTFNIEHRRYHQQDYLSTYTSLRLRRWWTWSGAQDVWKAAMPLFRRVEMYGMRNIQFELINYADKNLCCPVAHRWSTASGLWDEHWCYHLIVRYGMAYLLEGSEKAPVGVGTSRA